MAKSAEVGSGFREFPQFPRLGKHRYLKVTSGHGNIPVELHPSRQFVQCPVLVALLTRRLCTSRRFHLVLTVGIRIFSHAEQKALYTPGSD
jgi:hypothetical protein